MKIAIDISQLVHEGTGIASYTDQLVRNLLISDKENEYILFGISFRKYKRLIDYFKDLKKLNTKLKYRYLKLPPSVGSFFGNILHIPNLDLILGRVDIFHSSDWIQPPISAKKITTVHDLVVYKYPETSHPKIVETQKKRLFWVKKECNLIFCDSVSTQNDLMKILKIEKERTEVVYPGVDPVYCIQNEEIVNRVKHKYGLFDDYILSVGTWEPRKNLTRVTEAFEKFLHHPLISSRNKPIELVLIGNHGWGKRPKISKYVHQLGFIPKSYLPAIYSGASLFIYPSFYEGFGFPILEAMSCGCPVITSSQGSLQEIAEDAACLTDPYNTDELSVKMTKIIIDKDLKKDLIEKGLRKSKEFNWQKTAKKVISCYNRLFENQI